MKIRMGFVSNSSSSSFCIIGTENSDLIRKLAEAENKSFDYDGEDWDDDKYDYFGYGCNEGEVIDFYGDESPYYAGIDLKKFGEDISIKEMKKLFIKKVKKELGVDVEEEDVALLFGECGN